MTVTSFTYISEHANSEISPLSARNHEEREHREGAGERRAREMKNRNGKGGNNSKTEQNVEKTCWCFSPL